MSILALAIAAWGKGMVGSKASDGVLDRMLRDAAASKSECSQCRVRAVVGTRPDSTGCNWNVSRIEGCHSGDCLIAMAEFIAGMREHFLLESPDDMDPTLLTTWAMR